jgi:hypothetical protein
MTRELINQDSHVGHRNLHPKGGVNYAIEIWNLLMNAFNNWQGIEEYRNNISQQTRDGNLEANVEELCVCLISATAPHNLTHLPNAK